MGDRVAVMRNGALQQVGSPDEIYNRPQTLFVAGFVGSPPMNFFEGVTKTGNGQMGFESGPLSVALPDSYLGSRGLATDRRVTLAVRPQHLRVQAGPSPDALPVTVFALEHLGKESIVIFETPEHAKVRAIVEPKFNARVGERMYVAPEMSQALLFDPATEQAIQAR